VDGIDLVQHRYQLGASRSLDVHCAQSFEVLGDAWEMLAVPAIQEAANLHLRARFSRFSHLAGFLVGRRLDHHHALEAVVIPIAHLEFLDRGLLFPCRGVETGRECRTEGRRGERGQRIRPVHRIEEERLAVFEWDVPIHWERGGLVHRLDGHLSQLLAFESHLAHG
jgi:hypothetical protein